MRRTRFPLVIAACMLLAACSWKPSFINEYKIDIQQGNVLSQDAVSQLKPGQTRDQVRFLLGTPMVADIFHQQRWDYAYRYQNGQTGKVEARQLTVFFNADGRLERVAGDVAVADAAELNAPVARSRLIDFGTSEKPLAPPEEPGFFRRMLSKIGL